MLCNRFLLAVTFNLVFFPFSAIGQICLKTLWERFYFLRFKAHGENYPDYFLGVHKKMADAAAGHVTKSFLAPVEKWVTWPLLGCSFLSIFGEKMQNRFCAQKGACTFLWKPLFEWYFVYDKINFKYMKYSSLLDAFEQAFLTPILIQWPQMISPRGFRGAECCNFY